MRRRFMSNRIEEFFDYKDYMTIEALEEVVSVITNADVKYGINGMGWYNLNSNQQIILNKGQLLSLNKDLGGSNVSYIQIDGNCYLRGNCSSLRNDSGNILTSNFVYLLEYNTSIIGVEPAFLPATTVIQECYMGTFRGCSNMVSAPELPALNLVPRCYQDMFKGCSKLNYIKMLATNISAAQCLTGWVDGVSSYGTFVKHKDAVIPRGKNGIPYDWTVISDNTIFPAEIGNDEYGNKIIFDKLRTIGTSLTFNNEELKYVIQGNIEATVLTSVSYDSDKDAYVLTNPNAFVVHYLGSDGKIFTIMND